MKAVTFGEWLVSGRGGDGCGGDVELSGTGRRPRRNVQDEEGWAEN